MVTMVTRLLQALSYPKAGAFSASDDASVRALVAWLENMKVQLRLGAGLTGRPSGPGACRIAWRGIAHG